MEAFLTSLSKQFCLSEPILPEYFEVFIDGHVVVDDVFLHIEDILVSLIFLVILKGIFSVALLALIQFLNRFESIIVCLI